MVRRFQASGIGPYGFAGYVALVMADGRLALLGGQGGIPGVDGYAGFALWNPSDNSISVYASNYGAGELGGIPFTQICGQSMGNIGAYTRTPDRTKVVIGSIFSDGTLCEFDEATATNNFVSSGVGFIERITISPDGKWIVLPEYPGQAVVFSGDTLSQAEQFSVAGNASWAAGFFISSDSRTLFTPSETIIYAYDLSTGLQIGWTPNILVVPASGGGAVGPIDNPNFQAVDTTGLYAGPMEEGVGFLDVQGINSGPVGSQFTNGYLNPATGPASGGTSTSWPVENVFGPLLSVTFGSLQAPAFSSTSASISATSPPAAVGPADVYALTNDGGMQILPEAFSYGPTPIEVTPNAATAEGGQGVIFAYGFGPTANSNGVPPDLSMTVKGQTASITAFISNAYGPDSPPFPLQAATYTIPPAAVGPGDVTVTTSSGSATMHNAMTYLPAVQQFPLPGAALAQGVYDPLRDVYYFTDGTSVRVFSRTIGAWLNSIPIPAAGSSERLWGISLSPDGSMLAIADMLGKAIDVLSPDSPSTLKAFPIPQTFSAITQPVGVAVNNSGIVYFTAQNLGVSGAVPGYFSLNTGTGQFTELPPDSSGLGGTANAYSKVVYSPNNSSVYFNADGVPFSINTATNQVSYASVDPGCCYGNYELALSGDQTRLAATDYFYDAFLNGESYFALNLRETMNIQYIYGQKLSPDGHLLFQPSTLGIDVFDGRLGNLLTRIALPVTLSPN